MFEVIFKATVVSKTIVQEPLEGEAVKLELVEERPMPPPLVISGPGQSELAREVAPIVQQVVRAMPFGPQGKVRAPRLTLWLTRSEWERLEPKPELGDEVQVKVSGGRVEIGKP